MQRNTPGSPLGTRCEVKNLNGVRFLQSAIGKCRCALPDTLNRLTDARASHRPTEFEVARQISEIEAGRPIEQATRGFDAVTGETFHLRGKEDGLDYRFMPDPELGPVVVYPVRALSRSLSLSTFAQADSILLHTSAPSPSDHLCLHVAVSVRLDYDRVQARLESLRQILPELPDEAFDRLQAQYGLSARDAGVLVALGEHMDDGSAEGEAGHSQAGVGVRYFEEVAEGREGKVAANW